MLPLGRSVFSLRAPGVIDRLRSRVLYLESYRKRSLIPPPDARQRALVEELHETGSIVLEGFVPAPALRTMQAELETALQNYAHAGQALRKNK